MLQCQPWPEKQNLHLFLNVLNFKPLEMMQKRFFSEPVSCEEKQPLGPALGRDPVPGRHRRLFPRGLGSVFITARL